MERMYNLVDIKFNKFSIDEKRYFFMILDIMMKRLHERNFIVTSFNPKDIYYENGEFIFSKVAPISSLNSNSKEEAILNNIIGLSTLAFCCYLPSYNLENGLLNNNTISGKYNNFKGMFNQVDSEYYQTVLVDSFNQNRLPEIPYFYDYVKSKENNMGNNRSNSLVKATEYGKLMTEKEEVAGFGTRFFLICLVSSFSVLLVGFMLFMLNFIK